MNINSCVAHRLEIACYSAPSRLALDAHCSPKKTQFITFRGIYLVMVWQKSRQFGLNTLKQGLFTKPIIIVLQTYFWMSRCGGGSQILCYKLRSYHFEGCRGRSLVEWMSLLRQQERVFLHLLEIINGQPGPQDHPFAPLV